MLQYCHISLGEVNVAWSEFKSGLNNSGVPQLNGRMNRGEEIKTLLEWKASADRRLLYAILCHIPT